MTRGSDTIQIRKRTLSATRNTLNQKTPEADTLITKSGCLVEIQRPAEVEALTTIDTEIAWIFMPVDNDTRGILTTDAIDFDGRTFEVRGPRAIERRIDGTEVQVWCVAEWQAG
jgi:hypothetical protein